MSALIKPIMLVRSQIRTDKRSRPVVPCPFSAARVVVVRCRYAQHEKRLVTNLMARMAFHIHIAPQAHV